MIKRIFLFLLTNIAVIAVLTVVIALAEKFLWISISGYSQNYTSVFIYALIVWFTWAFISLWISKWMAKKAYWVVVVTSENISSLSKKEKLVYDVVMDLSNKHWIKMPEVWFYDDKDPNAFATWASKNSSLVAASSWLLDQMNENEIEWVIGHEMAHILNWDMVTMTLLQWVLNTFVVFFARILANIFNNVTDGKFWIWGYYLVNILLQILFGILASVIAMWFSRYREYRADEGSAKFLWKEKMISALEALKKMQSLAAWDDSKLAAMKISTKKRWGIMSLFSSHPDLDDRIKNLQDKML